MAAHIAQQKRQAKKQHHHADFQQRIAAHKPRDKRVGFGGFAGLVGGFRLPMLGGLMRGGLRGNRRFGGNCRFRLPMGWGRGLRRRLSKGWGDGGAVVQRV